jgi:hypothetical protein
VLNRLHFIMSAYNLNGLLNELAMYVTGIIVFLNFLIVLLCTIDIINKQQ